MSVYANCFRWLNNLFKKGNKGELEDSDIYDVLPEDATQGLADELERLVFGISCVV